MKAKRGIPQRFLPLLHGGRAPAGLARPCEPWQRCNQPCPAVPMGANQTNGWPRRARSGIDSRCLKKDSKKQAGKSACHELSLLGGDGKRDLPRLRAKPADGTAD